MSAFAPQPRHNSGVKPTLGKMLFCYPLFYFLPPLDRLFSVTFNTGSDMPAAVGCEPRQSLGLI